MQYVHIDQADDYVIPIPLALVGLLQDIAPVGVLWEARLHLEGVAPSYTERVEVEPFGLPFSYDGWRYSSSSLSFESEVLRP